jgi:hypothetical protein
MKTTLKLFAVLALALVSFGQNSTASAGNVFHFKGQGADAVFSRVDASGCIFTDVFVQANEQVYRNLPGQGSPFSGAFLSISQFDGCSGTQLLSADGFAELAGPEFQVSGKQLESASLTATINMYDYLSNTSFSVDVNITWTGTNARGRQNSTTHYDFPGCKVNSHYNTTFRYAEASGSVSDGAMNFTPEPSVGASIFSAKSGDVVIGCN